MSNHFLFKLTIYSFMKSKFIQIHCYVFKFICIKLNVFHKLGLVNLHKVDLVIMMCLYFSVLWVIVKVRRKHEVVGGD